MKRRMRAVIIEKVFKMLSYQWLIRSGNIGERGVALSKPVRLYFTLEEL